MKPALYSMAVRSVAVAALALCVYAMPAPAANPAQSTATRNFEKTLTLGANQTFAMEHKFGEVRIHGENGREVKISATIRVQATTQGEADHNVEQIKIEVSQDSEGIKVRTVYPEEHSWYIRVGKGPSYSVDYDITVPSDAKLWVRNNFGNMEIRNVHGWADVENGHGKLEVRDSGAAKLANSFGQVEVSGVKGNLTVVDNNGAVGISAVKGTVDVKDRFGTITVSDAQGAVSVAGGNGGVEVSDAGAVTVSNSFGSVNARNIRGDLIVSDNNGSIDVNTVSGAATLNGNFGSITFSNVNGHVKCTSANGKVKGGPAGERRLREDDFWRSATGADWGLHRGRRFQRSDQRKGDQWARNVEYVVRLYRCRHHPQRRASSHRKRPNFPKRNQRGHFCKDQLWRRKRATHHGRRDDRQFQWAGDRKFRERRCDCKDELWTGNIGRHWWVHYRG